MKKIIAFLALTLVSANLFAEDLMTHDNNQDWYFMPSIGYFETDDSDRGLQTDEDGLSYAFEVGKRINDRFNLELGYSHNKHEVFNSYFNTNTLDLDALLFLNRNRTFSPFVIGGVGIADTNAISDTNPIWGAGAGFLSDLGVFKNAKLRVEARLQQEVDGGDRDYSDTFIRAGIQIPFGAEEKAMPKMEPKDSDGDGAMDADDKCPATPAGAKVNSFGCELDSDAMVL